MTQRFIHYEAAFEDYVRSRGWPYVPVDEHKRVIFSGARIKSFDLIVYRPGGTAWLVDVKGRKFPYEVNGSKRYWENWVTREDLDGLHAWKDVFGEGFEPVFVFAYWLLDPDHRLPSAHQHTFRAQAYSFLWIPVETYARHAARRSAKWDTVTMPVGRFRELAKPVEEP